MIIDKIDNITKYEALVPGLCKAYSAIMELGEQKTGKYMLEEGFFLIQSGESKPLEEGNFEAHRKYIDVQIIVEGCEEVAWAELSELKTVIAYDAEKDAERLEGNKSHHMLISEGMFYIALPHDGHQPVSHTTAKHQFKKIVLKMPAKC